MLTSPLERAQRTCTLAGFGAAARIDPNLQEWDYGHYEGRTSEDIHAENQDWDVLRDAAPGGESIAQVLTRIDHVIATLQSMEGRVANLSHEHFLRALAMRWIDLPLAAGRNFVLDTAAISRLGYEDADQSTRAILLWNSEA